MQIGVIEGATRVIGKSQGYLGLPLRDEKINCSVNGDGTPAMTTAWIPTSKELAALTCGASVHVRILGTQHPPIMVEVGEPPDELQRELQKANLRTKIANVLRNFHRNSSYPEADDTEVELAVKAIVRAMEEEPAGYGG